MLVRMKNMWMLRHGTSHRPSSDSIVALPMRPRNRDHKLRATRTRGTATGSRSLPTVTTEQRRGTSANVLLVDMKQQMDRSGAQQNYEK